MGTGDSIFEVVRYDGNGRRYCYASRRTWAEADQRRQEVRERVPVDLVPVIEIEEVRVTTDFDMPRDGFRDRYRVETARVSNGPGHWDSCVGTVLDTAYQKPRVVATVTRDYPNFPYEPFRQGDRDYMLVAPHHTGTSVLDLATGEIVAAEPVAAGGFCPVGFHVPDWWDVHDGSILPGSQYWQPEYEQPSGLYGFVWGCVWGDDSSWKVQHLDLSRVADGVLQRDDRYGYVPLATNSSTPPDFIDVWSDDRTVTFSVLRSYRRDGTLLDPVEDL